MYSVKTPRLRLEVRPAEYHGVACDGSAATASHSRMDYLFRLPKFPVLLDAGEVLICAKSRAQLESRVSKFVFVDNAKRDIIDSKAEGFALYPEKMFISPSISLRRWTKMQIINLYNTKRKPGYPELRTASIGSRSLESIVGEAVELLARG